MVKKESETIRPAGMQLDYYVYAEARLLAMCVRLAYNLQDWHQALKLCGVSLVDAIAGMGIEVKVVDGVCSNSKDNT